MDAPNNGGRRLLIYPLAWIGGEWRYLLFRNTLSRRGAWRGLFTVVSADDPIEPAVSREVQRQTGLTTTAVRGIDYAYRYSALEQQRGRFAPVHRDVLETAFMAFIKPAPPVRREDDSLEWRWFSLDEALESLEWLEHAEALQKCAALVAVLTAPLAALEAAAHRPRARAVAR